MPRREIAALLEAIANFKAAYEGNADAAPLIEKLDGFEDAAKSLAGAGDSKPSPGSKEADASADASRDGGAPPPGLARHRMPEDAGDGEDGNGPPKSFDEAEERARRGIKKKGGFRFGG